MVALMAVVSREGKNKCLTSASTCCKIQILKGGDGIAMKKAKVTTTPIYLTDLSVDMQREQLRDESAELQATAEKGETIIVGYWLSNPEVEI